MWAVDWVLDWLQQIGEGAVHNVGHKITKGLKYKIPLPQMNLCNFIYNWLRVSAPFSSTIKDRLLRNIITLQWTCQHTTDNPIFTSTVHIKQRFVLSVSRNCVQYIITIYTVTITSNRQQVLPVAVWTDRSDVLCAIAVTKLYRSNCKFTVLFGNGEAIC